MQLSDLDVARARYLLAAQDCWKAWKAYAAVGGLDECLAYARFALPAPDGHARTDTGMLFDAERD